MRRYWIDSPLIDEDLITITGDSFHHIFGVCRHELNSQCELLGIHEDSALLVKVMEIQKKKALVKIVGHRPIAPLANPKIILNLSFPKFSTLETIVEKSVELGVHRLQLFTSDYSFLKKTTEISSQKKERLTKIALQATQQCGRSRLMLLPEPVSWSGLLESFSLQKKLDPSHLGLLAYEHLKESSSSSLKQQLSFLLGSYKEKETCTESKVSTDTKKETQNITESVTSEEIQQKTQKTTHQLNQQIHHQRTGKEVWLFVGSEGGFSSTEVQCAEQTGLHLLSLGSQILRVETACVVLLSSLKYELELM
jgi:16S rRNA (uracil1498-N3)-methyltransferase